MTKTLATIDIDHYVTALKKIGLIPTFAQLPITISLTAQEIQITYDRNTIALDTAETNQTT